MPECKLCNNSVESLEHEIEQLVIDMIKKSNSDWVKKDGACPKCIDYYRNLDNMAEIE